MNGKVLSVWYYTVVSVVFPCTDCCVPGGVLALTEHWLVSREWRPQHRHHDTLSEPHTPPLYSIHTFFTVNILCDLIENLPMHLVSNHHLLKYVVHCTIVHITVLLYLNFNLHKKHIFTKLNRWIKYSQGFPCHAGFKIK